MRIITEGGLGIYRANEFHILVRAGRYNRAQNLRGAIFAPGHNANAKQWYPGTPMGNHARELAKAGVLVLSVDAGGGTDWGNADAMLAMDAAYAYLVDILGCVSKVDLCGYDMGGLTCLNWLARNQYKVNATLLMAPIINLDSEHDTNAPNGVEIDAAHPSGYTAYDPAANVEDYEGLGPITIYHGTDDTDILPSLSESFATALPDDVELHLLDGASHTDLFDYFSVTDTVKALVGTPIGALINIVWEGDSMSGGIPTTTAHHTVAGLTDTVVLHLSAWPGETAEQMIAQAATQVDPYFNPDAARNIAVFWAGGNDIDEATPGQTDVEAAVAHDRIETWCSARQAAGFEVVVATILPRSNPATGAPFSARRAALNTLIRDNWETYADALCDLAANATIGDDGDEENTTYYSTDDVHLTEAGRALVASIFRDTLETIGIT